MNSAQKEKIDALWMETRRGQFILLVADGKWEEAKEIDRQAFNEGFVHGVFAEEKGIEEKMMKQVESLGEWEDYVKTLDESVIEALYETKAFSDVQQYFWRLKQGK